MQRPGSWAPSFGPALHGRRFRGFAQITRACFCEIDPCTWRFCVRDASGVPIRGAELFVVDARTGRPWPNVGNWKGPETLLTDEDGVVVFRLSDPYFYGWESKDILGYEKSDEPVLMIALRYQKRALYLTQLGSGGVTATVDVVLHGVNAEQWHSRPQGRRQFRYAGIRPANPSSPSLRLRVSAAHETAVQQIAEMTILVTTGGILGMESATGPITLAAVGCLRRESSCIGRRGRCDHAACR